MKTCSAPLLELLTTQRTFFMADLYSITLADGTLLRYTSAGADLHVDGRLFLGAGTPLFARGATRCVRGVEVDSLEIEIHANNAHTINGVPWLAAIATGVLDGARLELERAFAASPNAAIAGTLLLFSGRVSDTSTGTLSGKLTVRSDLELLNIKMPRNLYQPGCLNIVFDTGCGKLKTDYAANGTIAAGSSKSILLCNLTAAADHFTLGEILCTSGQNAGVRRAIRDYATGQVMLSYPLPKPVTVGDTFTAWPGCDGRLETCKAKFANGARYRAYPFIPVPETSV